ncbi:MAG: aminopeptidase P N-terminal domain-containing protein, partial [Pedococcus sp.]
MSSEEQTKPENRARPTTDEFRAFVAAGWAPRRPGATELSEAARYAAERRTAVSAAHQGDRLIIPAGGFKVRSNDTDYVFRPHTAFVHLTGLGGDREPDAVLVLEPRDDGSHEPILYFRPLAGRDSDEFFADARYGEFWVGARPTIEDIETELGLTGRHIDEFADAAVKDSGEVTGRVVRDADRDLTRQLDAARASENTDQDELTESDDELAHFLSHLRLTKDEWEVQEMRKAVEATHHGFEAVIADLPEALANGRGERWVEGVFGLTARHEGNGVGYDSICAAGDHATTLHWIKNTGEIRDGDLILLDAGVEVDSLFTADVTRTLPVNGTFSDAQREIYDAVYAA